MEDTSTSINVVASQMGKKKVINFIQTHKMNSHLTSILIWFAVTKAALFDGAYKVTDLRVSSEEIIKDSFNKFADVYVEDEGQVHFDQAAYLLVTGAFQNEGLFSQAGKSSLEGSLLYSKTIMGGNTGCYNDGMFVYNYSEAMNAPTFQFGRGTDYFINNGLMWFGVAGKARLKSKQENGEAEIPIDVDVSLTTETGFHNDAYLMLAGHKDHILKADLDIWLPEEDHFNDNDGTLCLSQCTLNVKQSLQGRGCLSITSLSSLWLRDDSDIDVRQKLFMDPDERTAYIHIEVTGQAEKFTINVIGFTKGCAFKFSKPMQSYVYRNGELSFTQDGKEYKHYINIGYGYRVKHFKFDGTTFRTAKADRPTTPSECECYHKSD